MSSCTAAMQTHALALAIEASKSFARRRFRLSQARVRFDDPSVTRSNKRARSDGSLWRKMCFSCGDRPQATRARKAGNLHVLGLHLHLWAITLRELPASTEDPTRPHVGKAEGH